MLLGLETFSYHLWFSEGRMDVFRYIERCAELGLDGVQINVNGRNFGHLGGNDPGRLREIRELVEHHGMFIEIDSRGTDPEHLRAMLKLCEALGADVLRTYASCGGELACELAEAPEHLEGTTAVRWVAPHPLARDAHRAEAEAGDGEVAADAEGAGGSCGGGHAPIFTRCRAARRPVPAGSRAPAA